MENSIYTDFERTLAFHSAPAMLGLKPANLISLAVGDKELEENIRRFNLRAASKGLEIRRLCGVNGRQLLLVYNLRLMERQLEDPDIQKLFKVFGYAGCKKTEDYLAKLSGRIADSGNFPHEIGLFLGYPVDDVKGFIANKGENYLICGYWKVYSDEQRARRIFTSYNRCRSYILSRLDKGEDIYKALRIS